MKKNIHTLGARVAIVGAGFVGSTTAYTLLLHGVASHLTLIDKNAQRAQGEMLELQHCMQFAHSAVLQAGDSMELAADADVIVVCAGVGQAPGESRLALAQKNVAIFKEIIPALMRHNKTALLLVVTNPLDIMTYITYKLSGLSAQRVFGSGTVLDTARLRYNIAQHFSVSPKDVVAHVIGEHGDTSLTCWSGASVAGIPLELLPGYDQQICASMHAQVKNAAYEIISRKGATYYAIALAITKIVRALVFDQARIFSVSSLLNGPFDLHDVCISVPTLIKKEGVCQHMPLPLSKTEYEQLHASAQKIKDEIQKALAHV